MPNIRNSALFEIIEQAKTPELRLAQATILFDAMSTEELWQFLTCREGYHGWVLLNRFFQWPELHALIFDKLNQIQRAKQQESKEEKPQKLLDNVLREMMKDKDGFWLYISISDFTKATGQQFLRLVSEEVFFEIFAQIERTSDHFKDNLMIAANSFFGMFFAILARANLDHLQENALRTYQSYQGGHNEIIDTIPKFVYLAKLLPEDLFTLYRRKVGDKNVIAALKLVWEIEDRSKYDDSRVRKQTAFLAIVKCQSFNAIIDLLVKFFNLALDEERVFVRFVCRGGQLEDIFHQPAMDAEGQLIQVISQNNRLTESQKVYIGNLYLKLIEFLKKGENKRLNSNDRVFQFINELIANKDSHEFNRSTLPAFLERELQDDAISALYKSQLKFLLGKVAIKCYEQDENPAHIQRMQEHFLAIEDAVQLNAEDHFLVGQHLAPLATDTKDEAIYQKSFHHLEQARKLGKKEAGLLLDMYTKPAEQLVAAEYNEYKGYKGHPVKIPYQDQHPGWRVFVAEFATFEKLCTSPLKQKFLHVFKPVKIDFENSIETEQAANNARLLMDILSDHRKKFSAVPAAIFQRDEYLVALKKMEHALDNLKIYNKKQHIYAKVQMK